MKEMIKSTIMKEKRLRAYVELRVPLRLSLEYSFWQLFGDFYTSPGFPNRRRVLRDAASTSSASLSDVSLLSLPSVSADFTSFSSDQPIREDCYLAAMLLYPRRRSSSSLSLFVFYLYLMVSARVCHWQFLFYFRDHGSLVVAPGQPTILQKCPDFSRG